MVPSTVAELLGDPRTGLDRHDVVPRALAHRPGVTEGAARLFDEQVGDAVSGLLDVDLAGLVLDGWSKYGELRTAARRSLERPGRDEPVTLVEHRITSTHEPAVLAGLLVVALGAAGLLSGVVAVPASAWPWSQPGVPGVVEPDTAWNMRAGPSRVAKPVGVVLPGQSVRVECVERGWAKLLLPRHGTYVDGRGLRLDGDPPDCSP